VKKTRGRKSRATVPLSSCEVKKNNTFYNRIVHYFRQKEYQYHMISILSRYFVELEFIMPFVLYIHKMPSDGGRGGGGK
jgi:hypothetical protein